MLPDNTTPHTCHARIKRLYLKQSKETSMKKIILSLIACTSVSLMPMKTLISLCDAADNDCCREALPYATQDPFYQPDLSVLTIQNPAIYQPQMSADEPDARSTQFDLLEHAHRPPYNPAVGLFLAIRAALSSRTVIPVQTTESSVCHVEEEIRTPTSCTSNIVQSIWHCISFSRCIRRQATD
jgi:hypothetical protein